MEVPAVTPKILCITVAVNMDIAVLVRLIVEPVVNHSMVFVPRKGYDKESLVWMRSEYMYAH